MIRAKSYFIDANSNTNISHLSGILSHQTNDPTKSKSPPKTHTRTQITRLASARTPQQVNYRIPHIIYAKQQLTNHSYLPLNTEITAQMEYIIPQYQYFTLQRLLHRRKNYFALLYIHVLL